MKYEISHSFHDLHCEWRYPFMCWLSSTIFNVAAIRMLPIALVYGHTFISMIDWILFSLAEKGANLWLDPVSVNAAIANAYRNACDKYFIRLGNKRKGKDKTSETSNSHVGPTGVYKSSPVSIAKALKNHAELEGMRNSHLRLHCVLSSIFSFALDCVIL